METEDRLRGRKLLQPISSSVATSSRSWIGSTIVILAAIFAFLTPNEGHSSAYQRVVDSLFHTWFAMGGVTAVVWLARRGMFGALPRPVRIITGPLIAFFLLASMLDFLFWQPLWSLLKP